MATLVIDRQILPEQLASFFAAPRIAVMPSRERGDMVLSPVINPDDYATDAEYLAAIPGMMESIMESVNAPDSESIPVEEVWSDVFN